jgi:hypothetical protein
MQNFGSPLNTSRTMTLGTSDPTSSSGTLMCEVRKAPECPLLSTLGAPRNAAECDHAKSGHKITFRLCAEENMDSLKQAADDRGEK